MWDLWEKKYHTLILPRVWLKTKITQIHALAKTRNHCFDQYILYHQHSYTNSALLQRRILVLGKHAGSKNDERLVWKQLCARNKVFNRLEASQWVTATGIKLIIFEFANLWLDALNEGQVYPWVHRWRFILLVHIYTTHSHSAAKLIVTPIIFSISYELFRLPLAKIPQDYQLLRTFVWKVDPEQFLLVEPDMTLREKSILIICNQRPNWCGAIVCHRKNYTKILKKRRKEIWMEHFDERKNNPTSVIADGRKQFLYNRTKQP